MATKKKAATAKKPAPAKKAAASKKAAAKPAAKKAVKPAPKPVAKKAVKTTPAKKVAAPKKAAKPAPKPVAKKAVKPAAKQPAAKKPVPAAPAQKPVAKAVEKPAPAPVVEKPAAKPEKVKAVKAPKVPVKKVIRESVLKKKSILRTTKEEIQKVVPPPFKKPPPPPPPRPTKVVMPDIKTKTSKKYEPDFTKSVLDQDPVQQTGPTMRYSDAELTEFRELIQKKLDAAKKELSYLQGLITRKDEMGGDESENRYMTMEDGSVSMEREQLSQMASRQITFIDHLEKAMMRIENKTYGICRVTGKLIDKARLRAVPHATLSIEAKQTMNK
jgi:RNA polymerase-binding transcription factor DksA